MSRPRTRVEPRKPEIAYQARLELVGSVCRNGCVHDRTGCVHGGEISRSCTAMSDDCAICRMLNCTTVTTRNANARLRDAVLMGYSGPGAAFRARRCYSEWVAQERKARSQGQSVQVRIDQVDMTAHCACPGSLVSVLAQKALLVEA